MNEVERVLTKRNLRRLTPEEKLAIVQCTYVFRPGPNSVHCVETKKLLAGYAKGQLSIRALSSRILNLTSMHLPEVKSFSAHACRHLVATEYIKNKPNGWDVAAEALHNTVAMVRKHYSWVAKSDRIKPWNNYHEDLKAKYDRGEL